MPYSTNSNRICGRRRCSLPHLSSPISRLPHLHEKLAGSDRSCDAIRLPKCSLNNPPKNHKLHFPLIMKVSFTNYENILLYFQNTTLHYKLLFNLLYTNRSTNGATDVSSWYSQHAQPLNCFTLY